MQLLFIGALSAVMATGMATLAFQSTQERPAAVQMARSEVDQYRIFMYVASRYMQSYSGGAGTIGWNALKGAPGLPSGVAGLALPSTWKVVVSADNSWVACTPLAERSVGIMQQLAVQGGVTLNPSTINGSTYLVVGNPSDTAKAAACS